MQTAHTAPGFEQYCFFFDEDQFIDTGRPGFRRRIILGEHLELWFWRITGGSGGSVLHNHEANEQLGIIMRGALDFRIGDPDDQRRVTLKVGECYLAGVNIWHGDSNFIGDNELNEVWILDVFSPPRSAPATQSAATQSAATQSAATQSAATQSAPT